jgi:DNA-binding NarL/FixJ family response regulator
LADDDVEIRQALRVMLEQRLGVIIAGEAAHTYGLAPLVEGTQADIVIIDWDLPYRVDAWLVAELRRLSRKPLVVITSSHADVKEAALLAGADAFVDKSEPPEAFLGVVQDCLSRGRG